MIGVIFYLTFGFLFWSGLVGDLHGDLDKAKCALETAGVLSSDGQGLWIGGETVSF